MKKLGLFALIAVLFTACSQDNTTDNALQPELLRVGFEEGTRVQLNDQHQTVWNTGDMVSVFYKSDANSCYSYTGEDKARTGVISKVDNVATTSASLDKVYAVYPYNADYTIDAQGVVSATVSANQTYAAGSYGIGNNIMVATGGSAELIFQNVYGWVRLQFTGKDSVSKLVFRGNNNEVLAGAATINPNDATIAFAAGGATELTLDCSNVTLTDAATEFYIAVAPQAFEKGFEVEAHTAAGVKVFNKGTATTITRNVVTTMATTEIDVITPISDVTTAGTYAVTGTVVAVGTQAYIIADNTGAMMVYHYNNGRTVGENITISGEVTIYQKADGTSWGTPQFSNAATVVVNSTDNAWTYNPSVLDAAGVDAMLTETLSKEVEFAGKLVVSGNYINIEIAGATVQGSVKYVDNNAYADLNGKDVTVKGYFVGVSSKKYVNVLPYSIEAKESVNPEPEPEPSATIIDAVANVKAGKYYMAGYAEQYNNSSNGTVTTFAPYSYHMWTGGISTGSNFDLLTVNYSYENEKFALNPNLSEQDAAKGTAQLVELVAVDGKTNAYYIKMGDKYLTCTGKRKAALVDTPTEWAFTDHAKGGICLTDVANNVILGTAGATYNLLRCYVAPASSLLYGVAFISADAAFDSTTPTPDPEPDPEPEPTPGDTVAINTITTAGTYTVTGTVVAVGTQAYIIADNTGAMMVYHYNNGRTVGENITISGEVTIYQKADGTSWGTPQFSNAATVVVNSTDNAWTYNPSVLDAAGVDAMLTETLSKEVEFAGKLVVSGNYINIEIAGATVQGSVKYVDNNAYADLNGKDVTVKGYFVGVSSKKYVNVLPYSIEAKESVNPEPEPEPSATIIDAVANVKAGKYYMAGYAEQYNNSSNGTVTTFAPYSYHMWTGGISTGSNFDLLTVNYSYENEKFALNPNLSEQDAAKGTAQLVELVAVDGKTNAYYIKMGDKYLTCTGKRKAALVDTPTEWAFTDHAKGGICLTDVANNVILGTAGATYNLLRCYVAPASSLLYGVAFISADAAFDSTTPTPDPEPEPEPEPSVKALPYTESFKTSQGDFTINDVELGSLSYVWKHSTYNDSGYMKASAFKTAAVASESWLISPAISLSDATSPVVTFSHAHKFAGTPSNELTLWVSANDGAWEQVTIPTYSSNADWTFVESGEISLAKYVGSTIKVAFKYVSSTSAAATWEVKDFSVAEGSGSVTPEPEPEPEPTPDSNGIVWEIGLDLQSWNADTNATYGAGFIASDDNISVGYYQHKSTSKAVEPKTDHIRIYKSSALVITPLNGKTIKKVVIDVTYASTYALDMNVLSDGTTAVGDTTAGTITWSGSTDQFVAEANNGQVRVKKLTVITE